MSSGSTLSTAQTSDSLDALGCRIGAMAPDVHRVTPAGTFGGSARTVLMGSAGSDSDNPYDAAIDFIDSLLPGDVVVVATDGSLASAVWGELFTAAARGHGALGLVTDGLVRDRDGILELGWPVFATGFRPVDYRARQQIVAVDVPVVCAGMPVTPGDWIVGDGDGVVVVPRALKDKVVELVERRSRTESTVLSELMDGASLRAVWEKYRVL